MERPEDGQQTLEMMGQHPQGLEGGGAGETLRVATSQ